MYSCELVEKIRGLPFHDEEYRSFISFLEQLSEPFTTSVLQIGNVIPSVQDRESIGAANKIVASLNNKKAEVLKNFSPFVIHQQVLLVRDKLLAFCGDFNGDFASGMGLSKDFRLFLSFYEEFLKLHSVASMWDLSFMANNLLRHLKIFEEFAGSVQESLSPMVPCSEGEDTAKFYFPSVHEFSEFLAKTKSISTLYTQACYVLRVNEHDYPVKIVKIETGSSFFDLVGHKEVFKTVKEWIEIVAAYCYRSYTVEGKKKVLTEDIEAVQKLLNLRGEMEKNGIDTNAIDTNIQSTATMISQAFNDLFSNQSSVIIDRTTRQLVPTDDPEKLLALGNTHELPE